MTNLSANCNLLRIFVGEYDTFEGELLYQTIVKKARQNGIKGATVLKGIMGYGKRSIIHTNSILRLSEDMPIVIEIVDREDKVRNFLNSIEYMLGDCLATIEKAEVLKYQTKD